MRIIAFLIVLPLFIFGQKNPVTYVNPFIGTGWHGHTFPGAVVPFGMVQLSPDTRVDGSWDGCSGYHQSDSLIYGFSHTHLSGTGCSDYGDIMLMPATGNASIDKKKYACEYSHKNEKASAGFYSVKLKNGVEVKLTATTRVGIHSYSFPSSEVPQFIFDLTHRDETKSCYVKITGDKTLEGERISKAWATDQHIYYAIEFSEKFDWEIFLNDQSQKETLMKDNYYSGKNVKAILRFPDKKGKTIFVKVGISNVSVEGAKKNLKAEAPDFNFDNYKKAAEAQWNKELSKISVTEQNKDKLIVFYTALYHCFIHPSIASDVDGSYRGRDNKIHKAEGYDYYSVFSLWDTYRGLHPLLTLIDKKRTLDFIKTFIAQFEDGGRLPVWELSSNETDCMIGYHSVSVIADAYAKGITGFDTEKAFKAMKNSALEDRFGLKALADNGVISMDDEAESVSRTLEYSYDDWCIAQMAQALGKNEDYHFFQKRSLSWKNVFDKQTGFVHARKNGGWQQPFDPREVNNNFTEANSYQYSFYVPHDITGMINAYGGEGKFFNALMRLFNAESKTTGRTQDDISGLIGQYAHGNEPSHHMTYLFNYIGKYGHTVRYVDEICKGFYKNDPMGLIGNEDCGQMSAWYVLSAMGLYPVCPGSPDFIFGKPQFAECSFKLENGQSVKITKAKDFDYKQAEKVYFNWNNTLYNKLFITNTDLEKGGELKFIYDDKIKNTDSLKKTFIVPQTSVNEPSFVSLPVVKTTANPFANKVHIELQNNDGIRKIRFRTDPGAEFQLYTQPFDIDKSCVLECYEENGDIKSPVVKTKLYKRPNNWTIKIKHKYNPQYTAGGDLGVLDGIRGDVNWRKGEWQGFQPNDFEAVIDMIVEKEINEVKLGCLQDTRSWILFPEKMEVYASNDGKDFVLIGSFNNKLPADDYETKTQELGGKIDTMGKKYRYLKVIGKNPGKLPEWHLSKGEAAFIFVDEVLVK